jgi:beta-lactamase superfamily II metal-dependent hydrolase
MTDKLRVRMYNVRFGDAILVTIPDKDPKTKKVTKRHILIDVGNVLNKDGGDDSVFQPVIDDVLAELDGQGLDLYVMTHEHLDHVQGLYHAATRLFTEGELTAKLAVRHVWLTASAAPDYGQRFPKAEKQKKRFQAALAAIERGLRFLPADRSLALGARVANNNPRNTEHCVSYLRTLAPKNRTHYVFRGFETKGKHPFKEAKFEIWAPEEDSSSYYRSLMPMAHLGATSDARTTGDAMPPDVRPLPPPGVDAGSFQDLVDSRRNGFADNLLMIDKAANNTSVVFVLTWRGHRLLFSGDAELGSWRKMKSHGVLSSVEFLKVSHHGSHNGTPAEDTLDLVMPKSAGKKGRVAAVSTWDDTYSGIPHSPTNAKLTARGKLRSTLDQPQAAFYDTFLG